MIFRVRTIIPRESKWFEVESGSLSDAIQDFHVANTPHLVSAIAHHHTADDGARETVYFSVVEAEGESGTYIARTFCRGLARRGGIKPPPRPEDDIAWVATQLGWKGNPEELLAHWDDEESWYDAGKRRLGDIKTKMVSG